MSEDPIADQIASHNARNASLLAHLRDLGASLDQPRTIDCFFWAPTRDVADALRQIVAEKGLRDATVSEPSDEGGPWSVQGRLSIRPDTMGSPGMTEELVQLAAACGAEYDGWGTRVSEANDRST